MFKDKYIALFKNRQDITAHSQKCGYSFVSPVNYFSSNNPSKIVIQIDLSMINTDLILPKTGFLQVKLVGSDLFESCSWEIKYSNEPVIKSSDEDVYLEIGHTFSQSPPEHGSEFSRLEALNTNITEEDVESIISRYQTKELYMDGYIGGYPLFIQSDFRDSYLEWNEDKEDFDILGSETIDLQILQLDGKYFGHEDAYFHIFISQKDLLDGDLSKSYTYFDFG